MAEDNRMARMKELVRILDDASRAYYVENREIMSNRRFDELYDEDYSYYILQLSCYSLCLMQLGYEIADRKIIWLKEDGTYDKVSVPDYTDRMRLALHK